MNTQQLVTLIKEDFAPGYARTKILSYIARAQEELFNQDCAQMKFYNGSDIDLPIPLISTTAETLQYTPSESNLVDSEGNAISLTKNGYAVSVRKISKVFIQASDTSSAYNNTFIGENFDWSGINDNWSRKLYNIRFEGVPIIIHDRSDNQDAYFIFVEDPDTHTDRYYIEFYVGPVALDSESIPLSLDANKWSEAIIKAVRGYIEESRNGRSEHLDGDRRSKSFRSYWLPTFRNSMNANSTERKPLRFPTRHCL